MIKHCSSFDIFSSFLSSGMLDQYFSTKQFCGLVKHLCLPLLTGKNVLRGWHREALYILGSWSMNYYTLLRIQICFQAIWHIYVIDVTLFENWVIWIIWSTDSSATVVLKDSIWCYFSKVLRNWISFWLPHYKHGDVFITRKQDVVRQFIHFYICTVDYIHHTLNKHLTFQGKLQNWLMMNWFLLESDPSGNHIKSQ